MRRRAMVSGSRPRGAAEVILVMVVLVLLLVVFVLAPLAGAHAPETLSGFRWVFEVLFTLVLLHW